MSVLASVRSFFQNRRVRIVLLTLLGLLFVGGGVGLYLLLRYREELLQLGVRKVTDRAERRYPVRLLISDARFTDLTTVTVRGVKLVPRQPGADTLLRVGKVTVTVSLRSVLHLRPVFSDLQLEGVKLTAVKRDSVTDNFGFLMRSNRKNRQQAAADSIAASRQTRQFGQLLNGVLDAVFENIPQEATFRRVTASYLSPHHRASLRMPRFRVGEGRFRAAFAVQVDSVRNVVRVNGTLDPDDYHLALIAYSGDGNPLTLPYIGPKYHARVALDTLRLTLEGKEYDSRAEMCTVRGVVSMKGLQVTHRRIANHPIIFPRTAGRFQATLGPDYASLDQPTAMQLGQIVVSPQVTFRARPVRQMELHVRTREMPAQAVLASLPRGMFDEIEGMQATGTLQYSLDFKVNMARLDSLVFDSNLRSRNFHVTRFGAANLAKLNREFAYTAYDDKGDSVKTFMVGPSNPHFVPYDEVSPYLPLAIMTAEDPRFFNHKGFMESAFRKSLIQDIRERRFARGGSTLSMQLVKNVFLTRQKTIARKIEEVLITWIIENNRPRFVSKERMLEVYLNIIEWGPRKYGVYDAAQFFFAKHPSQLDLNESLFLASIIPAPRRYRYSFDDYGNLRGKPRYFFRLISGLMLKYGWISQTDHDRLPYAVTLMGPAHDLIVTARDTTGDTLDIAPIVPPNFIGPVLPPSELPQLPMGGKREDATDVLE